MDFMVGQHSADGTWEELDAVTASNPASAFSQWVEGQGGVEAGEYGVRSSDSDTDTWEWLFRADDDGLHPVEAF